MRRTMSRRFVAVNWSPTTIYEPFSAQLPSGWLVNSYLLVGRWWVESSDLFVLCSDAAHVG